MKKYNPRTHIPATEAAKRMGICRRTLLRWIRGGKIEAFQHSARHITVSVESIVAYENRVRISAGSILPEEAISAG